MQEGVERIEELFKADESPRAVALQGVVRVLNALTVSQFKAPEGRSNQRFHSEPAGGDRGSLTRPGNSAADA